MAADDDLRKYLQDELSSLVTNQRFLDVVEGFLPAGPDNASPPNAGVAGVSVNASKFVVE